MSTQGTVSSVGTWKGAIVTVTAEGDQVFDITSLILPVMIIIMMMTTMKGMFSKF